MRVSSWCRTAVCHGPGGGESCSWGKQWGSRGHSQPGGGRYCFSSGTDARGLPRGLSGGPRIEGRHWATTAVELQAFQSRTVNVSQFCIPKRSPKSCFDPRSEVWLVKRAVGYTAHARCWIQKWPIELNSYIDQNKWLPDYGYLQLRSSEQVNVCEFVCK